VSATPEAPADPAEAARLAAFWGSIYAATPRTPVTVGIVAVNVVVFVATLVAGAGLFRAVPEVMLKWGANYGPVTGDGEPWRLLTYMFLHYGVVHLAFNMWALWDAGRLVERLYGNIAFLLLYVLSGICGGLASLAWNTPQVVVAAGASGAVFGVYGALFAFVLRHKRAVPKAVLGSIGASAAVFVAFSLFIGALVTGIDNAAHLGGLAGGFVGGFALARPAPSAAQSTGRLAAAAAGGVAVVVVLWTLLPPPPYRYSEQRAAELAIQAFLERENETVKLARAVLDPLKRGEISEPDAADRLEREVVPRWEAVHRELSAVVLSEAAPASKRLKLAVRYTAVRREILTELAAGLRTGDKLRLEHANVLAGESRRLLEELVRDHRRRK
jgi:rhomboid protease GluP